MLSSTSTREWQFTYLALGRTAFFSTCMSCPNSILCGTYILCSYADLPPLLHPCPLPPLNPCNIYTHIFMLTLNLPFKASYSSSLFKDSATMRVKWDALSQLIRGTRGVVASPSCRQWGPGTVLALSRLGVEVLSFCFC
jgi:hypothetical protein